MMAHERLVVALDFPSRASALEIVEALGEAVLWYKVGLELYLADGAGVVEALRERGKRVFLDLKLHDIPNTVAGAVRVVGGMSVDLLTVHAAGGPAMLAAAVDAAEAKTQLLAVTVLTSMKSLQLRAVGVEREAMEQVETLAAMALACGVNGLVCSPLEVAALRRLHGPGPLLVVPGIRERGEVRGDQARTASAGEALEWGASMLVVGRPITRAASPQAAADRLLREMDAALHVMAER